VENLIYKARKESDLIEISQAFLEKTEGRFIFAFDGDMGAGKTTFIKQICKAMGIEEETSSPTYGFVNEYYSPVYGTVYHFDCYRVEDENEAYDFGMEEYLYGEKYCFIEWPKNIDNLLPDNTVWIKITANESNERIIEIKL
jgi:tRNA threonylcarbamoyladenosine biosynthesis protein TsaE